MIFKTSGTASDTVCLFWSWLWDEEEEEEGRGAFLMGFECFSVSSVVSCMAATQLFICSSLMV
jgi:hypothetical protein